MNEEQSQLLEMMRDLLKINAVIATELIQLVENSSQQLRGNVPESCRVQHTALKQEVIAIDEKWNDPSPMLNEHNLKHK